jgi:hypothetical protein
MASLSDYFGDIDFRAGFGGQGYGTSVDREFAEPLEEGERWQKLVDMNKRNAETYQLAQQAAAAQDQLYKNKGLPGGTKEYNSLSPEDRAVVDRPDFNLKPSGFGSYRYPSVDAYLRGQERNLVSALIDRGVRDQASLEKAVTDAKTGGAIQNVNPFQGLVDQVNNELGDYDINKNPKNYNVQAYNPSIFQTVTNPEIRKQQIAKLTGDRALDTIMSYAVPAVMGAALPITPSNMLLEAISGRTPYGQVSRYGLPFELSKSIRGDDKNTVYSSFPDIPTNVDYGNEYIPQAPPVQTLDPNINAGAFNREAALEELIGRTQGNTINPGISDLYFNDIIRRGLTRQNQELGENIDENQFNNAFGSDFLGQGLLDDETTNLRGQATDRLNQVFTGNAFDPLDDSIINSIVQERAEPARKQISTAVARGNYNPTGGRTANQAIDFQTPAATSRVREIGEGVLGGYGKDISALKDTAQTGISGFKLGDDLFDVSPFAEQRSKLIEDKSQSLQGDISDAIGNEPLFNSGEALAKGGRVQGVVSGQPSNQTFLDTIAAREAQGARNSRSRGLGSRGSGVF